MLSNCTEINISNKIQTTGIMVTGIAQDAGYPQLGCDKACCKMLSEKSKYVSSVALIDSLQGEYFIIDATPDLPQQIKMVEERTGFKLGGVLLTHAHIGHSYTEQQYFGNHIFTP